ncbi:MAG: D-mannonate dehydratase, partial [Isosphaeraceae bacterium]
MLQYLKRHGVNHICGYPPDPGARGAWTAGDLRQTRAVCEQHGVALDMVALPLLTSSHIDHEPRGAILLGKSPERERDIERIQTMIAA